MGSPDTQVKFQSGNTHFEMGNPSLGLTEKTNNYNKKNKNCLCNLLHLLYNGALPRLPSTCWNIKRLEWQRNIKLLLLLCLCCASHFVLCVAWFIYVSIFEVIMYICMHEEFPCSLLCLFFSLIEEWCREERGFHGSYASAYFFPTAEYMMKEKCKGGFNISTTNCMYFSKHIIALYIIL